jgi:Tol biopolymer transport system component
MLIAKTTATGLLSATVFSLAAVLGGCGDRSLDPSGQAGTGGGIMTGGAGSAEVGGTTGQAGSTGAAGDAGIAGAGVSACGPALLMNGATGKIAFDTDRDDFNRNIYMMNVDGSGLTRLTNDPGVDKEPAFSPDGKRISFSSDRAGAFEIFVLDLSTMQVTQVTDLFEGADQSSFSHDGTWIAFHSGASVWIVHPDGTGETMVATGLDTFNAYSWPHFSADDSELVFDRNNEIDAVHLDGTGFRRIVQNWTTTIKSPAVSPGGSDVAYAVWCDTQLSVWTTPFSTTTDPCKGRRVTPVGDLVSQRPTWGPNNLIAYERVDSSTNVGEIAVISRSAGSVPCLFTADLSDNRNPAWSF